MQTVPPQTASTDRSYRMEDWRKGYLSQRNEYEYWLDDIEGHIPAELSGTLFRNGPGLFDINGDRFRHPFDGDGMVCSIAFSNGRAYFRNRFVRTEAFVAEQKANKILYRGVFGTQKPGGWMANTFDFRLKNIANTNVIHWGGKLLALWEAAEPYRLNPLTLETIGKDDLNGGLSAGESFGAHPHVDPSCDREGGEPCLVNFSIKPGLSTKITVYELNQQGNITRQHSHAVPGFAFIHDFAITENYCIFIQNAVTFNPIPFALGLRGAGECLSFNGNQPAQIVIVPRHSDEPVKTLQTNAGFIFHHANAFEQNGKLYIDSICYQKLSAIDPGDDFLQVDFDSMAPGQLWRFALNTTNQTVERTLIESRCCEFPTIHPDRVGRPYRYLYYGAAHHPEGNAPLQAIAKLDLETGDRQLWSDAPSGFAGEPVFVPRPNATSEDDGWLLTLFFNADRNCSDLIILDARDVSAGAIARLHLKHHVPYGLHGSFTDEYFGPTLQ